MTSLWLWPTSCWLMLFAFANAIDTLRYFELLDAGAVRKQIVKRGVGNQSPVDYNRIDQYFFRAFRRDFRLFLTPSRGLLSSTFEAVGFDKSDVERIAVDSDRFYTGHVFGEQTSKVIAYLDDDGLLTANIKTTDEAYVMEPAWRHIENSENGATLIFRESDLKNKRQTSQKTCLNDPAPMVYKNWTELSEKISGRKIFRAKRDMDIYFPSSQCQNLWRQKHAKGGDFPLNRCPIKLVADYLFYKHVGRSDASATVKYLIALMDRVNALFLDTEWRSKDGDQTAIRNMGFVIKKIEVHKSFSNSSARHYNVNQTVEFNELLHKFSEFEGTNESQYCLVHLFTFRPFPNGILGLGYIAHPSIGSSGGICCSPVLTENGHRIFHNTAVSSLCTSYNKTVVTREADLVTAHELGHNWGSHHDSFSNECSPDSANGGLYIMNTFSVSGYDQNNKKFSPCSLRIVKSVLQCKSDFCFVGEQKSFCGNKRVEEGEDCDEDILGNENQQPFNGTQSHCCTSTCKFKRGAVCSAKNSPCCTEECQYAESGKICSIADYNTCKEQSNCTGLHAECPEPPSAPDRTNCLEDGECRKGECVSFCEKSGIDLKPCICENVTESCFLCCRNPNSTKCVPFILPPKYANLRVLSDGTRCIHGRCSRGVCQKDAQDFVQHFWSIIGKWNINFFLKFLHDNIVGTVIIVTLIFWIPASCWISHLDRKKFEANKRELGDWASLLNGSFVNSTRGRLNDRDRVPLESAF